LLILVLVSVAVGVGVFGLRQLASKAVHGMRAGICTGLAFLVLIGMLSQWAGRILENLIYRLQLFGQAGPLVGIIGTAIIGLALLAWAIRLFFRPNFEKWLIRIEDLGWFTTSAYKRSQGQRVRRGTILAVLVLAGCGIYTLLAHHSLENGPKDWQANIPFTGRVTITDEGDLPLVGEIGLRDAVVSRLAFQELNDHLAHADLVRIADPGKSS